MERTLMQPLLDVRDLTVCYRAEGRWPVVAVDELSFDIAAGEAVGLLGESGCGKTTLGLTLLGLLPRAGYATTGSVVFEGTDLLTRGERELRHIRGARISMVHQEAGQALNPVIRVGDQIAEVIRAHNPVSLRHSKEEAKQLLAQVGFEAGNGIDEAYPHQLSGGQKQRVVIAQAIACHPALIIADEPTTALDTVTQTEILALLKTLQEKLQMALLLINHDPGALEQVVDRILVMYAGRLVEVGPTYDVLLEPLHPYTRGLLRAWPGTAGTQNHRQLLPVIPGEPPDHAHLPVGCAFETRCPDGRRLCRTRRPQELPIDSSRRVACVNYAN
jgi:oligopeptide/dipeptide ABC transporter ATP-binding protein